MAKKNSNIRKNKEEEFLEDQDFSSEDINAYKPSKGDENLELNLDEEAYGLIEYIELEWPSLSIDSANEQIYMGSASDPTNSSKPMSLIEINLQNTDFRNLKYKKTSIHKPINKLRINNGIFTVGDNALSKFDMSLKLIKEIIGNYRFSLYLTDFQVFVGTSSGMVEVYDHNLNKMFEFQAHNQSVESICCENGMIFTGSTDHLVRIFTCDGKSIEEIPNDSDINCLDVRNGKLVYGDDNGKIFIYDINSKTKECIKWHNTPISLIRWRDDDIFASGSDEQLCLWDITLEEDSEAAGDINKYLLFVHQGQKFYKDCCFDGNKVISTSQDGVCIFEPISLISQ